MRKMNAPRLATLLVCCALPALADTISITPDADTTISEVNPFTGLPEARADGTTATMIVGHLAHGQKARGLLRFDLSELPADATITSARLDISIFQSGSGTADTYSIHRMTAVWDENAARWDTSGSAPWTGGSFAGTADSSTALTAYSSASFPSSAAMLATVKMWHTNPASNFGWLMKINDEVAFRTARRIGTKEYPANEPKLVIQYTTPPPPPPPPPTGLVIYNLRSSGLLIEFNFEAFTGTNYTVEYTGALGTSWDPLTNVTVATSATATVTDAATNGMRFYRIGATPVTP